MDIAEIKNRLGKETAIMAYLDLSNMFHWQDVLKWRFRIEDAIAEFGKFSNMKEIKVYYGLNLKDMKNSEAFHKRIRKTGAVLKTKPVKYIKKTISDALFFKRATLNLFDGPMTKKIATLAEDVRQAGILIEEPKCNFDVEMTMDMLDDSTKISAVILCSGDSDFQAPLERLKIEGKKVYVMGVRGQTSKELFAASDYYIDFGKFYTGRRMR